MSTYSNSPYLLMLRSLVFVCMGVFEGQSIIKMPRTSLSVLGRFLFGECEILFSSVFPLQPFQCSWYHVFDMDPITDAPRHFARFLNGFSSRFQIKQLKTSRHPMNKASELSRPHLSTRLCNSSFYVSMLRFETVSVCIVTMLTNCDPFNRRPRTCLGAML